MLVSPPLIKQARTPEPSCLHLLLLPYSLPFLAAQKTERGTERSSFAVVPPSFLPLRLRPFWLSLFVESLFPTFLLLLCSAILPLALQRVRIRPSQPAARRTGRTWYRPYVHFSYARKFRSSRAADQEKGEGKKLYSELENRSEDENTHVFLLFPSCCLLLPSMGRGGTRDKASSSSEETSLHVWSERVRSGYGQVFLPFSAFCFPFSALHGRPHSRPTVERENEMRFVVL